MPCSANCCIRDIFLPINKTRISWYIRFHIVCESEQGPRHLERRIDLVGRYAMADIREELKLFGGNHASFGKIVTLLEVRERCVKLNKMRQL